MKTIQQSPTDHGFVQNPYPFYATTRADGPLHFWADYGMVAAFTHESVHSILRDRRFGREIPAELAKPGPDHLAPFLQLESHSMLDAEPPRHTRLRALVLRAFTSRAISALAPEITTLCQQLINRFPDHPFDLLPAYCNQVPVITICRLLGVPQSMAPDLLEWSHAMVAMYQANPSHQTEISAAQASSEFSTFLRDYIKHRRTNPRDDLITRLITAEEAGAKLSINELVGTCVLLLNAGHEATVHSLGNAIKTMLETKIGLDCLHPDKIDRTTDETLRYDPPLHMFTRYAYEPVQLYGHQFERGDQVALVLGAANRDPTVWEAPDRFDPSREAHPHTSLGGGLHFCVGAPLARLEMKIALPALFQRYPDLQLDAPLVYANSYHFHGLQQLVVRL